MKEHDVYPSQWLVASDFPEGGQIVTVSGVSLAEVGREKESKPVLSFQELDKGLILNKTNWRNMVNITKSDESDEWTGVKVELYGTKVQFGGEEVDAVRIRAPRIKPASAAPAPTGADAVKAKWAEFYRTLKPDQAAKVTAILSGSPSAWLSKTGKSIEACIGFVKAALEMPLESDEPKDEIPFD